MSKQIFQDASPEERLQYLKDSAVKVDEMEYFKELSPDERELKQERLVELQSKIIAEKEEKAEVVKQYNEALKDKQAHSDELVQTLKMNAESVNEQCYFIPDDESRMMHIYNPQGVLVRSRPLNPDEAQHSIFQLPKSGTHE